MSTEKIFVTKSDTAVIECPKCGIRKSLPVGPFKGKKHVMKVKCACSHIFKIELNFRRHYRKKISNLDATYNAKHLELNGHYQKVSKKKQPTSVGKPNCIVKDLSFGGVGFEVMGKHLIEPNNKLMIIFNLDNAKKTLINRQIVVKTVNGNTIGGEFIVDLAHDPELGFYLMP